MTTPSPPPTAPAASRRRWPLWVAGAFAAAAAVAMTVSLIALRATEQVAGDTQAELSATTEQVGRLESEVTAGSERIDDTRQELTAMRALLQPGTPEALQAVYLQIVAAGCADPSRDIEAAVADIAASQDTAGLSAQPGWEAAIDRDAISAAMADCEAGDG